TEKLSAARAFSSLKEPASGNGADHGVRTNLPRITRDKKFLVAPAEKSFGQRNCSTHAEMSGGEARFDIEQMMIAERIPKLVPRVENVFVPVDARGWPNRAQLETVRHVEDVIS